VFITSIAGYGDTPWMGKFQQTGVHYTGEAFRLDTNVLEGTSSASKRAIEIIADHLRLEVQPFGATVMMIVTGAVISRGQTYFSDFALPEGSLYKRIESTIAARAHGEDGIARMPTADYATAVVDEIVKRKGGKFWYGEYAEAVKSARVATVPQDVLVSSVCRMN
jgi:1-acylglycerone phosphate reductase